MGAVWRRREGAVGVLAAGDDFAYYTGWRVRSEVLPLTWAHVDTDAQTVRLDPGTTKNDEGRTFPYGALPELRDVFTA